MAAVRSIGLHQPSALPHLIAESILPANAYDRPEGLYTWQTTGLSENDSQFEEEILTTKSCVVWSRGGVVRRMFNLDVEGESIVNTTIASFPARALVVTLKTQIHIFFLSGDSHVIPLPFEVELTVPMCRGVIFQRKITQEVTDSVPAAPPNSFVSNLQASRSFSLQTGKANRPSLTFSPAPASKWLPSQERRAPLPRLFCLTDPHSEMGLVEALSISASGRDGTLEILDQGEEILYVSKTNELLGLDADENPLVVVLTMNESLGIYTIWTATYKDREALIPSQKKRKKTKTGTRSKRRSSFFGMTTGATTPVGRGHNGLRESFGGADRGPTGLNTTQKPFSAEEPKPDASDDLASRLGPEFGDVGAASKSSRRVSSILARADVSTSHDRTAFADLASGNPTASSFHSGRRGESLGGFSSRASFGPRRESGLDSSVLSNGSSFLDAPVDRLLEELGNGGDFAGFEGLGLRETVSGLSREMRFTRVESLSGSVVNSRRGSFRRSDYKVFTIRSPEDSHRNSSSTQIALCISNRASSHMLMVTLDVKPTSTKRGFTVRATDLRSGNDILDTCRLVDGPISRVLVLQKPAGERAEMTLRAPWSNSIRIKLPQQLLIHNPWAALPTSTPQTRRDGSIKRVISDPTREVIAFEHEAVRGEVDVVTTLRQRHRLRIQLRPQNPQVQMVLSTLSFVLGLDVGDGLLVTWWHVLGWLAQQPEEPLNPEWTALVVVLFCMVVPYVQPAAPKPVPKRRAKTGLLRSASGSNMELANWDAMQVQESDSSGSSPAWMYSKAWSWITDEASTASNSTPTRSKRLSAPQAPTAPAKTTYLIRCADLARDFLRTPEGQEASGPNGAMPVATSKTDREKAQCLSKMLVGLHLLREEQKLDLTVAEEESADAGLLAPILAQLGGWLGWESWSWKENGYYSVEIGDFERWQFEENVISLLDRPAEPFPPPSIFEYVELSINETPAKPFLSMADLARSGRGVDAEWLRKTAGKLTPRTFAVTGYLSQVRTKRTAFKRAELLLHWGLDAQMLETLPDGITAPLHEAIAGSKANPPLSWNQELLDLVDRDDILMTKAKTVFPPTSRLNSLPTHEAVRDYHNIAESTLEVDVIHSFDSTVEADRQAITKLIFHEDRRYVEVLKVLSQSKPPVAECYPEPEWTEAYLLEVQKELVQHVVLRTLSVPCGRSMLNFSARVPLLTEKLPIPSFSLQCVMKPSNVTFSVEKGTYSEEKVGWAFFHNGAATGLAVSKAAKGIDTSWILYNRPSELTNRHAGFLLALGLNGHLKSIQKWVAFKYLTPKHTMTSIGFLLGLSASYLGTMDTLITRLLSVHVTRMLPPGAAELNLSPLTQTTGIMGIGLLYCNSQHRRMSEVMLSEIESTEEEEPTLSHETLRDEGYRLAAGFALGYINLGKGNDLRGLQDMRIVDRLLAVAVGTRNVDHVHILDRATAGAVIAIMLIFMKTNDKALAKDIDIPDTVHQFDYVRPDIFLLRTLAKHLILWDSIKPSKDWVKSNLPKPFRSNSSLKKIRRLDSGDMSLFNIVAGICFSLGLRFAGSGNVAARDLLIKYLDQFMRICRLPAPNYDSRLARNSARNCQDLIALSTATVMAGSGDIQVFRRLRSLHGRADADTPYGSHLAAHMAVGGLFLGGGSHTFGTSNLAIASLICAFYPLFPTTVLDNKCHLQAFRHMWVLATEARCLIARDVETRRPVQIPVEVQMKSGEKSIVTSPCLLPELDTIEHIKTKSPDYWDVQIQFGGSNPVAIAAPTQDAGETKPPVPSVPTTTHLLSLPRFPQDQSIYIRRKTLFEATSQTTVSDPASLQHLVYASQSSAHSPLSTGLNTTAAQPSVWNSIFTLQSLSAFDLGEQSLVLGSTSSLASTTPSSTTNMTGPHSTSSNGIESSTLKLLRKSIVDERLVLEHGTLGPDRRAHTDRKLHVDDQAVQALDQVLDDSDEPQISSRNRLYQLRLLFAYVDGIDARRRARQENGSGGDDDEEEEPSWVRRDVIERLRWRVWGVGNGEEGEE